MSDKKFAAGIYASPPHERAPEFVKARLEIKVDEAIAFLQEHKKVSGYVDLDIKESRGGKWYVELNEWSQDSRREDQRAEQEPPVAPSRPKPEYPRDDISPSDIPF